MWLRGRDWVRVLRVGAGLFTVRTVLEAAREELPSEARGLRLVLTKPFRRRGELLEDGAGARLDAAELIEEELAAWVFSRGDRDLLGVLPLRSGVVVPIWLKISYAFYAGIGLVDRIHCGRLMR